MYPTTDMHQGVRKLTYIFRYPVIKWSRNIKPSFDLVICNIIYDYLNLGMHHQRNDPSVLQSGYCGSNKTPPNMASTKDLSLQYPQSKNVSFFDINMIISN